MFRAGSGHAAACGPNVPVRSKGGLDSGLCTEQAVCTAVRASASTCCQVKFSIVQQTYLGRDAETFVLMQNVALLTE
jgi:hypothetical protein